MELRKDVLDAIILALGEKGTVPFEHLEVAVCSQLEDLKVQGKGEGYQPVQFRQLLDSLYRTSRVGKITSSLKGGVLCYALTKKGMHLYKLLVNAQRNQHHE